jgi:hypothetical protein
MIVYQMNGEGKYVGQAVADPDPMQPGHWLIPAGCVTLAPPKTHEGEFAVWNGTGWQIETSPPLSIEDLRTQANAAMTAWIDRFLGQFTAGVSPAELASWPVKATHARAHIGGAPQPMIMAEAAITGEDAGALAQKIVAKSDAYEAIIASVTGLRRATEAAIAAADTQEAVAAALDTAKETAGKMAAQLGIKAQS